MKNPNKEEPNISILVAYHKNDVIYRDTTYTPIHVGRSISPVSLEMMGDDTGDNISHKNGSFCELTALYWAWKNLKGVDFIGLCHYRRFFDFHNMIHPAYSYKMADVEKFDRYDLSIPDFLKKKLKDGCVVVSKPMFLNKTLFAHYCRSHFKSDFQKLREIVFENGSNEFTEAFDKVMLSNRLSPYNMFIMSWDDFDGYCSWLFDVLFKLETRIDISKYDRYQKRIFGFMAERLLSVYMQAKGKKRIYYPVIQFVDGKDVKNRSLPGQIFSTLNKKLMFMFNSKPKEYPNL